MHFSGFKPHVNHFHTCATQADLGILITHLFLAVKRHGFLTYSAHTIRGRGGQSVSARGGVVDCRSVRLKHYNYFIPLADAYEIASLISTIAFRSLSLTQSDIKGLRVHTFRHNNENKLARILMVGKKTVKAIKKIDGQGHQGVNLYQNSNILKNS